MLKKVWEYKLDIYKIFIGFRQEYDSVQRQRLLEVLYDSDIQLRLVRITIHYGTNSGSELVDKLHKGLKQGMG